MANRHERGHGIFSGGVVPWSELHPATVVAVVFLIAWPSFTSDFFTFQIGAYSLILGTIALSLMMLAGYGGMVSLAQLTVAGFAAYLMAILGDNSVGVMGLGWPWWLTVPTAILAGAVLGALIGAIAVRTEGIYTIMITLAIAVALFFFVRQNYVLFNGWTGFAGVEPPTLFGIYWRDPVPFYYLSLVVAGGFFCAVVYLSRSTFGLGLQAIRDNPRRMQALGFDVALHRIFAFFLAGLIAATAGVLLVWFNGRVSPGTMGVEASIDILVIAVVGGLRHPIGPFLGAIGFVLLENFAIDLIDRERFNTVIGLIFLLVVLFSPDGLLGLWNRIRPRLRFDRNVRPDAGHTDLDAEDPLAGVRQSTNQTGRTTMYRKARTLLTAAVLLAGSAGTAGLAQAQGTIKMGALATLEGAFAVLGQDSMRGVTMALEEFDSMAGGMKIELITGSSDASPDSAIRATRKLVEQDGVRVMVGPLSGSEGLAVKDYAKTQPNVTFVNGTSAAQDTTLRDPAPNFFRFSTDGAQWMAGLGEYAYNVKGYRSVAVLAEDYSFPYTQVFGFLEPFCRLGGKSPIDARFWVPIGNKDYSSVIAALPDDVDAIYVALGGADAINFLTQYEQVGGDLPLVAGSITVDQSVLGSKGRTREFVIGTPSAGPISDTWDNEGWNTFVDTYQKRFPDGFPSPSLFAHGYYINTKALLLGIEAVGGDLSDGGKALRAALSDLEFDTPTGRVKLDPRRNAIADIFLTEVIAGPEGNLVNKTIKVIEGVSQTFGLEYEKFLEYGAVGRENPRCG